MSVYEGVILGIVCDLYRQSLMPVRTVIVADFICKNDRRVRKTLAALERRGYVRRKGQRGGWMPERIGVSAK